MARPYIGITSDNKDDRTWYALPVAYATAVDKAGGVPFILPYKVDHGLIPAMVDRLDGVIFTGGPDLDPRCYGEAYHPQCNPVDPFRESFERALMVEVERRRMPALGICMGQQLMNLHRGGSMLQFLPECERCEPIEHRRMEKDVEVRHPVNIVPDTILGRLLGKTEVLANSSHKQAVKKVGQGLVVSATSPDGIIEGLEDPSFPLFLGVQWHPERLHEEEDHLKLFKLLVAKSTK